MADKKKPTTKKTSIKVTDLRATKNPKGGAYQAYISVKGKKQGKF